MVKIRIAKFRPDDVQPLPARMQSVAVIRPEVPPLDTARLFNRFTATSGVPDAVKPEYQVRRYKPYVCSDFHTDPELIDYCEGCKQHRSAHKEPL